MKTKARHVIDIQEILSENDDCNTLIELPFHEDHSPNIKPLSISQELDHENLVRNNIFPQEVEVEEPSNIMNYHVLNTKESS